MDREQNTICTLRHINYQEYLEQFISICLKRSTKIFRLVLGALLMAIFIIIT